MKKSYQCIVVAALSVSFLTGCAHRQPLSAIDPNPIGPVLCSLDPGGRHKPKYDSSTARSLGAAGQGQGLLVGLTALAMRGISLGGGQSQTEAMSQATGACECPQILNAVETKLKSAGYNVQPNAPATFTVKLYVYGLFKASHELAFGRVDGLAILKDGSRKELWRGEAVGVSPMGHTLKEYSENPELYRESLQNAADNFAVVLYNTPDKTVLPSH